MAEVIEYLGPPPLVVHPTPAMKMNEDEFFEFCQANGELRIERTAEGEIIIYGAGRRQQWTGEFKVESTLRKLGGT